MSVQLARISTQKQVTIPAKIFSRLRLHVGDYLGVIEKNGRLIFTPHKLIPNDQLWFWTKEWQEKEREADEDIATGRVSGPFRTAKDFMKNLKKR